MDCWTDNVACDAVQCVTNPDCIKKFFDPDGTAFAGCIKCVTLLTCVLPFLRSCVRSFLPSVSPPLRPSLTHVLTYLLMYLLTSLLTYYSRIY